MFLHLLFDKTETCLKSSALGANPLYEVPLNFRKDYETFLIQNVHCVTGLHPVQTLKSEDMEVADIRWPSKPVYRYSPSTTLHAQVSIQVASRAGGRESKVRILHKSMRMVLNSVESICTAEYDAEISNNAELSCSPILASYVLDTSE